MFFRTAQLLARPCVTPQAGSSTVDLETRTASTESLGLLRTRRFGTFGFASLLSNIGTWAQQVAEFQAKACSGTIRVSPYGHRSETLSGCRCPMVDWRKFNDCSSGACKYAGRGPPVRCSRR